MPWNQHSSIETNVAIRQLVAFDRGVQNWQTWPSRLNFWLSCCLPKVRVANRRDTSWGQQWAATWDRNEDVQLYRQYDKGVQVYKQAYWRQNTFWGRCLQRNAAGWASTSKTSSAKDLLNRHQCIGKACVRFDNPPWLRNRNWYSIVKSRIQTERGIS